MCLTIIINMLLVIGLLSFFLEKKIPEKRFPHIFVKKTNEGTSSVTLHIAHKLSSILNTDCTL